MSASNTGNPEFGRLRVFLWPIHRHELKKLLPMLLIFFLITFNYNILRTMKDTIVMYAPSSGAEVIPFIKVWAMFPGAILMTFLFTRLSNRMSREKVIYVILAIFLSYFLLFTFVLYPCRDSIQPSHLTTALQEHLPLSFKHPLNMIRNWTFTSFYVMSELWSNIVLFVLFWGFANQVTRLNEAKRFYGLFGIGANLSGVVAGQASVYLSSLGYNPNIPYGETQWEQSMMMLVTTVVLIGTGTVMLFRWMNVSVLTDPLYYDPSDARAEGRVQGKLSMREAFRYLVRSKYLLSLAAIVISYNLVINLVEVLWKHEVKELYPNPSDYNVYMNHVSSIIGAIATLSALLVSGNSIRKCGWTFTAMLTPAILLVTSIGFFGFFFVKEFHPDAEILLLGTTPLAVVVLFGTLQNILSRGAKYSVFDATKEMAFVPLPPEGKLKGKAAIDGVCSRLGKSGGSLIHQTLLLSLTSLTASAPYVGAILLGTIAIWIFATSALGKKFAFLAAQSPEAAASEKAQAGIAEGLREPLVNQEQLKEQQAL